MIIKFSQWPQYSHQGLYNKNNKNTIYRLFISKGYLKYIICMPNNNNKNMGFFVYTIWVQTIYTERPTFTVTASWIGKTAT